MNQTKRRPARAAAGITLAATLALLPGSGCRGKQADAPRPDGKVQETGKDLSKNPLQALEQLAQAGKAAAEQFEKAASRPPVEPVKFDVLLPLLPEPSGFTADEPQGSTSAMGEFKVTTVSRRYRREGEAPASGQIDITDGGFVPAVYAPFYMMSKFSQESTEGYQKGITVAGQPGFETWRKEGRNAELWVLVADRFLVHLRGDDVEEGTLREWLGLIDMARLATLS